MRVLVVARCKKGRFAPFITEQVESLKRQGVECRFWGIQGNGLLGYLRQWPDYRRTLRQYRPDVVHAHFVFSGLLACLQKRVPVVTTYHGSDINERLLLPLSRLVIALSAWNVFVSRQNYEVVLCKRKYSIIPCGVDLDDLQLAERIEARKALHLQENKKYILFSGSFDRPVKNPALAKESVRLLDDPDVELLEFKGYSREKATLLMCAVDVLLMTSLNEGSPQVIKEALACGCPIVSVDVGDVKERIDGLDGCYVASSIDPKELSFLLERAMAHAGKTDGRKRLIQDGLDNDSIARELIEMYNTVIG